MDSLSSLSCFICHDEWQTRTPTPVPIKKLPPDSSNSFARGFVQFLTKSKGKTDIYLNSKFEQVQYCSPCADELCEMSSLLQQLEKLNQDFDNVGRKVTEQICDSFKKLSSSEEDILKDQEFSQAFREEIIELLDDSSTAFISTMTLSADEQIQTDLSYPSSTRLPILKLIPTPLTPLDISENVKRDFKKDVTPEPIEMKDLNYATWDSPSENNSSGVSRGRGQRARKVSRPILSERKSKLSKKTNKQTTKSKNGKMEEKKGQSRARNASNLANISQVKNELPCQLIPNMKTEAEATAAETKNLTEVFLCPTCDGVFISRSEFELHTNTCLPSSQQSRSQSVEKNEATYNSICFICGEVGKPRQISRHMKNAHADKSKEYKEGTCNECGKDFQKKSFREFLYHYATAHQSSFTCTICNSTFSSYVDFHSHQTSHSELNLEKIKCGECSRIFKKRVTLNRHIKMVHLKEYKFNCDKCNWGGRSRDRLERHIKVSHDNVKDFACDMCSRKFATENYLKLHIMRHKGEIRKNIACQFCSRKFNDRGKLRCHEQAVHVGDLKHVCDICGKGFPIYNYLYIHLRSHETNEQKLARKMKARQAAEERRQSDKPILTAQGRPRVRPVSPVKASTGRARKVKTEIVVYSIAALNSTEDTHQTDQEQEFQEIPVLHQTFKQYPPASSSRVAIRENSTIQTYVEVPITAIINYQDTVSAEDLLVDNEFIVY